MFPSYTGFGGMPDPCCGGWIKHVYKVQMLDVGSQKWLDVGQIRTHISCGICYWKTVTP